MKKLISLRAIICGIAAAFAFTAHAQELDPTVNYVINGQAVKPWEMSLAFGKVKLDTYPASSYKGTLTATQATRTNPNDVLNLKWVPRGVKNKWDSLDKNVSTLNVSNKMVDLSTVQNDAAVVFDIKVIRAPTKPVDLTMECNWDWECRSSIALKSVFRKLPKKEWVSVPIPLKCFNDGNFDYSKITSIFMLQTSGKMEIELGDIRLAAFPAEKAKC